MRIRTCLLTVSLILAAAANASAGWVFVTDSGGEKQTTTLQDDRMKFEAPDHLMIFDLKRNTIAFANPEKKTYWRGSPDEFASKAKMSEENIEEMLREQLAEVAPEKRRKIEESLRKQAARYTGGPPPTVVVTETNQTDTILGHAVRKYEIWVDGELRKEEWIAADIDVTDTFDVARFGEMMRTFQSALGHSDEAALSSPKVIRLRRTGWPLRVVEYDQYGYPDKEEVVKADEGSIPDAAFEIPDGYARLPSSEIFGE